jgi:hypothetical protein
MINRSGCIPNQASRNRILAEFSSPEGQNTVGLPPDRIRDQSGGPYFAQIECHVLF